MNDNYKEQFNLTYNGMMSNLRDEAITKDNITKHMMMMKYVEELSKNTMMELAKKYNEIKELGKK